MHLLHILTKYQLVEIAWRQLAQSEQSQIGKYMEQDCIAPIRGAFMREEDTGENLEQFFVTCATKENLFDEYFLVRVLQVSYIFICMQLDILDHWVKCSDALAAILYQLSEFHFIAIMI